jgi:hypothetical protein
MLVDSFAPFAFISAVPRRLDSAQFTVGMVDGICACNRRGFKLLPARAFDRVPFHGRAAQGDVTALACQHAISVLNRTLIARA